MALPMKLRVLRARAGLTLVDAAEKIGIGRDTLSDLEKGRRHPIMPTIRAIADAYGVPVEELLEEDQTSVPLRRGGVEAAEPEPKKEVAEEPGFSHEVEADLFERADVRAWLRSVGANRILMLDDEILAKWEDFIESKAITEDASDVIAREFTNAFAEEAKVERALTSLLNRRGTILGDDDWNRLPEYTRMRRMLRARYAYYYRGLEAFNIRLYARGEANDVVTFSKRRLELLRPRLEEIKRKRDDMDLMDIRRLLDEIAVEEGVGV